MAEKRYQQIYSILKSRIQQGVYSVGTYLPSEHELCRSYEITRTTARRALDELLKEGFIEKKHGKGSMVKERRQSLGLLTVKGFSEAVGRKVQTMILEYPKLVKWPEQLPFTPSQIELSRPCMYFERLRNVGDEPVMLEHNWFPATGLDGLMKEKFVDGSFFKTLSSRYLIEIIGSEQELRAITASDRTSHILQVEPGAPILQIAIKFSTSREHLNIYSYLYCNTDSYPIGNFYKH